MVFGVSEGNKLVTLNTSFADPELSVKLQAKVTRVTKFLHTRAPF